MVDGSGFRPNTPIQLSWVALAGDPQARIIPVATVTTDANGNIPPTPALVFQNDPAGPRMMQANGGAGQAASTTYLVVPASVEPAGSIALFNQATQFLQRR
jgi:hypothetical protein